MDVKGLKTNITELIGSTKITTLKSSFSAKQLLSQDIRANFEKMTAELCRHDDNPNPRMNIEG